MPDKTDIIMASTRRWTMTEETARFLWRAQTINRSDAAEIIPISDAIDCHMCAAPALIATIINEYAIPIAVSNAHIRYGRSFFVINGKTKTIHSKREVDET